MLFYCYYLLFSLYSICVLCFGYKSDDSLVLAHILFRHGDRTNGESCIYPKDPYANYSYSPYGYGQLTKKGRSREYKLGQELRIRYGSFLGDIYEPSMVEAISDELTRSEMSLLLLLAGLFPPKKYQVINPSLNWQPIPYRVLSGEPNPIFSGTECPTFKKYSEAFIASDAIQHELQDNKHVFENISRNTGLNITGFVDVFLLHDGLTIQDELGLKRPTWAEELYPEMLPIAVRWFYISTGTVNLRRLSAGYLLKKIIEDTKQSISEYAGTTRKKLILYSGHEFNIAFLLISLGLFDDKIPEYGAYLSFEIHFVEGEYGIKIFYQNYEEEKPRLLKLPWCSSFCPFERFVSGLAQYMPPDDFCWN